MAASPPRALSLAVLLLLSPLLALASAAVPILEDGYTVSTAADLNPTRSPGAGGPQPYALLPRPRSGDLLLLDSAGSALYTLALPVSSFSADGEPPRRLAGGVAAFGRPRSVAVDAADNVYVADRDNGAIRKVAPSGYVTTIAGGYSAGTGRRDGPAQNATFSADFELVYVPKICALLVADRGNRMIRQINLKPDDCAAHETHKGLGTTAVSIIALLGALLGSVIGFLVRHFYPFHEVSINRFFSRIQKQYKRTQRKAAAISFFDIRSAVANSMLYALLLKLIRVSRGYLTILLPSTIRLERGVPCKPSPSLVDLDKARTAPSLLDLDQSGTAPSLLDLDQSGTTPTTGLAKGALPSTELLGDFIGFDGDSDTDDEGNESAFDGGANTQVEDKEPSLDRDLWTLLDNPQGSSNKIDSMIESNLSDFSGQDQYCSSSVNYSGVSRRRSHGDSKAL